MKLVRSPLSTLLKVVLCTVSLTNTAFSTVADVTFKLGELSTKLTTLQGNFTTLKDSLNDLNNAIPKPPENIIGENDVIITLVRGPILEQKFDFNGDTEYAAIVNAANEPMLGGGAIDGAISDKGGNKYNEKHLLHQERSAVPQNSSGERCPIGQARLTNGYGINEGLDKITFNPTEDKIKIIHATGPRGIVPNKLAECYTNCLLEADSRTLRASKEFIQKLDQSVFEEAAEGSPLTGIFTKPITSIAFCCISTGVFGYSNNLACPVVLQAVIDYFKTHPDSTIKEVRFVFFKDSEYATYKNEIETNFSTASGPLKKIANPTTKKLNFLNLSLEPETTCLPLMFTLTKGAAQRE